MSLSARLDTTPPAAQRTPRGRSARERAALALYAVLAAAVFASALRASLPLVGATFPGFLVLDNGILASVFATGWTGPKAALPFDGGVVTEVDGAPFAGGGALLDHTAALPPGTPIRYTIEHRGARRQAVVPTMRLGATDFALTFGAYLFIAAVLLGAGGLALVLRPDLAAARALAATLGCIGGLFALAVDHMTAYRLTAAYHLCEALAPPAVLNLALVFPRERVATRTRLAAAGGLAAVLVVGSAYETIAFRESPVIAWRFDAALYLLMAALGVGMVGSFAESFARGRDPVERTRAALVFAGGLIGFVLPAAALFSFFVLGVEVPTTWWTPFLAVFALFLSYAIVRHDLLESERVLRLSVGYVLATATMLVAYASSLALITRFVWSGAERSPLPSFGLVLAVALSFEPLRMRVQRGIDRVFYRSNVDVGAVLEAASGDLATLADEAGIVTAVEALLTETLGCERARVDLAPAAGEARAAAVEAPIAFRGERLGTLRCGAKRSGAPYSAAERDLVRGVASQTALAIRNARALRELRETQEQLLRSERLAAVGQFAGAVAHGIRNPLAGIRAAAQVAHLRGERGEIALESLANVLAESDRLDHRIRSLLDFSRPFQLRPARVDLVALLGGVRASLASRPGDPAVSLASECTTLGIDADPAYLEEALLELGTNALRAMPDGGPLAISLEVGDRTATIRFTDVGAGIPEGVRARLFDLFFTTRRDGTGIGLPTVKKIVELHGGIITVERTGPDGTVFRMDLPHPS